MGIYAGPAPEETRLPTIDDVMRLYYERIHTPFDDLEWIFGKRVFYHLVNLKDIYGHFLFHHYGVLFGEGINLIGIPIRINDHDPWDFQLCVKRSAITDATMKLRTRCPKCGDVYPPDAQFCIQCGAPVQS